jgi:LysR family transcriptional regulator, glycine cleavage system transcriptional activator
MRYPLPSLPALHAFEAAARLGSFTAAARELHLSPSTVSHRIRELESQLGFVLFERLPRSVTLTDRGKAYLPVVRAVFDELTMATVGLFGTPGGGRVTVRVPVSYGVLFLAPRLERLTAQHDIRVWLVSAIWGHDTPEPEVDLEVEFEDERVAAGGAETLGEERALLVGSPAAAVLAEPDTASIPLARVRVLGFENLWEGLVADAFDSPAAPTDVTVDTWSAAIEIVAAGAAYCALVPELLALGALDDGRIFQLGDRTLAMRQAYRLVRPERAGTPTPETSAVAEWLRAQHDSASRPQGGREATRGS